MLNVVQTELCTVIQQFLQFRFICGTTFVSNRMFFLQLESFYFLFIMFFSLRDIVCLRDDCCGF